MSGIRTPGVERIQDARRRCRPRTSSTARCGPKRLERLRRPGAREGAARRSSSRPPRRAARRSTTCCWPARPGSARPRSRRSSPNELGAGVRAHGRPGARAQGRRRELPHRARAAQRLLRRRDPPPPARARGDLLSGDGGPQAADHGRPGGGRPRWSRSTCPQFTLIGATTRAGLLTTPLRDRFGVTHRLELYEPADLARDRPPLRGHPRAWRSTTAGAEAIASPLARHAARGATGCSSACATTPRCAAPATSTRTWRGEALDLLEVDAAGLDRLDREILRAICEKFGGGPVGLSHARRGRGRGVRHDRGRLRAVSAPAGLHHAHARGAASRPTRRSPISGSSRPAAGAQRLF